MIAELFELHDRERFEIYAYAFGPDDGSAIRARIRAACDRFIDVADQTYVATSQAIYNDGVDILVDLKGYTQGSRPQIMALRPAPIQVNWLGYPGTVGADCIDYIIGRQLIDQCRHARIGNGIVRSLRAASAEIGRVLANTW